MFIVTDAWLAELATNADLLRNELGLAERGQGMDGFDAIFRIEKALHLSAFVIRKLLEVGELPPEAGNMTLPVKRIQNPEGAASLLDTEKLVRFFTRSAEEVLKSSDRSVRQLCNLLVHSCYSAYIGRKDTTAALVQDGDCWIYALHLQDWVEVIDCIPRFMEIVETEPKERLAAVEDVWSARRRSRGDAGVTPCP